MLWAYFDSSIDSANGYTTLAAIVSSEAIWLDFKETWMAVLRKHGVREFHMTHAMANPPQRQFRGLTEQSIKKIVNDLIDVLSKFAANEEFLIKACTVKQGDYFKVKDENPYLRRPEAMCVNFCCGTGLPPDPANPGAEFQDVIFFFDHNEKFIRHVKSTWEKGNKSKGWPSQVKDIRTITATSEPALQAVDVIAWAANGIHKGDDRAQWIFFILPLTGGMYQVYDYELIKEKYGNDTTGTDPYAYKARPPTAKILSTNAYSKK